MPASRVCPTPGCPNLQPCPTHKRGTEPSELVKLAVMLHAHRQSYRDPALAESWAEATDRTRELYCEEASAILNSEWLAERDERIRRGAAH